LKVGTPDYLRFCAADESLMSTSRKFLTAPVFVLALLAAAAVAQGTGRWMSGAVMPSERSEVAVAEVREKIYVLGGFRGELELEIYDPSMDRWSRGAAIPRAVHHAAAVGLNGKIYLIGGYVDGWMPSDEVHEYDPASNVWRALARMPTPRGALGAAVINGKIHAVSGNSWRDRNSGAHEVYDPETNRWIALAAIPTPRDHLAVAAVDGRLYAIGGRVNGNYASNLDVNEVYDPQSDRWQRLSPIPTARSGIAAAVLQGRIFVVGGETTTGTFNQVEAYDPKSDRWTSHARLPTPRHGLAAAVHAGRIYVISGGPTPGASYSAVMRFTRRSANKSWTSFSQRRHRLPRQCGAKRKACPSFSRRLPIPLGSDCPTAGAHKSCGLGKQRVSRKGNAFQVSRRTGGKAPRSKAGCTPAVRGI
jgi:N-acetylneuraminic acid mutarotase